MTENKKFTKADLIEKVAEKTGYTKKDTRIVVNEVFDTLKEMLPAGITIQGFAKFGTKVASPRKVRNFQTGSIDEIGERVLPKVRFSREVVNSIRE